MERMLVVDPDLRATTEDIRRHPWLSRLAPLLLPFPLPLPCSSLSYSTPPAPLLPLLNLSSHMASVHAENGSGVLSPFLRSSFSPSSLFSTGVQDCFETRPITDESKMNPSILMTFPLLTLAVSLLSSPHPPKSVRDCHHSDRGLVQHCLFFFFPLLFLFSSSYLSFNFLPQRFFSRNRHQITH